MKFYKPFILTKDAGLRKFFPLSRVRSILQVLLFNSVRLSPTVGVTYSTPEFGPLKSCCIQVLSQNSLLKGCTAAVPIPLI